MRVFIIYFFLLPVAICNGQRTAVASAFQRQPFHDRIDNEQLLLDKTDGKIDGNINIYKNEIINRTLSVAMLEQIDRLQNNVEEDSSIKTNNDKIRYLNYIENLVHVFRSDLKENRIKPLESKELVENFTNILKATIHNESMGPLIATAPFEICSITAPIFKSNIDYLQAKNIVYLKFCALNPDKVLQTIEPFVNETFADSLVIITCKKDPAQIYKYVQSNKPVVRKLIVENTNPVVKAVVNLSSQQGALLYFPFLDDIVTGKKQISNLTETIENEKDGNDNITYYKLLVQTEIEYNKRMHNGDTAIGFLGANGLKDMLKRKTYQHFILPMNEMHDRPDNIRMHPITGLSAIDIYYMLVMGEEDIYTSTYEKSFTIMLQRMGELISSDSLLRVVNFDYFKKFIKLAAGFNRLEVFLSRMSSQKSTLLMKDFVGGLEMYDDLEAAVDVADSYSSINNKQLQLSLLNYVTENEQRCKNDKNKKGIIIYGLLRSIFHVFDTTYKAEQVEAIGIPSIYTIDNHSLRDDSDRIVQQVFFYGDGTKIFSDYIQSFSPEYWKVNTSNKEWVEIKSINGSNIWIYANKPLNNNNNLDDTAQVHLSRFLLSRHLIPSIVIHRGHSYWLPRTMDRMPGEAKIVILGSCGGYKNLNQLLAINPDAHVVCTKQIGTGLINYNMMQILNRTLLTGNEIDWRIIWNTLDMRFSKQPQYIKDAWKDYLPPYKNLGSVFLKAFSYLTNQQ